MRAFVLRGLEALPLAVFLLYMAIVDPHEQIEWRLPYFAATALAFAGTVMLLRMHVVLNRIYVGIALYFVSGTIALLTRWPWLNAEYGRLEGTAMLYWVLAAGLFFTWFSSRGFIGLEGAESRVVRRGSLLLLAFTAAATVTSAQFLGNRLFSSFLPFIAVFAAHAIIKARLRLAQIRGIS